MIAIALSLLIMTAICSINLTLDDEKVNQGKSVGRVVSFHFNNHSLLANRDHGRLRPAEITIGSSITGII